MPRLSRPLLVLGLLFPVAAFAIGLPSAPCDSQQFGCGAGAANIVMSAIGGGGLALTMLRLAAALAVLYIIWAGFQMVISNGDEGKISQYKWSMAYALIGLCVSALSQFIISSVGSENYGQTGSVSNLPFTIIGNAARILRLLLDGVFLIMIVLAGLKMLYAQGKSDEFNSAKKMLTWALVGAVLVNLSAALVYAVGAFFHIL